MEHLLSIHDLSVDQVMEIFSRTVDLKAVQKRGTPHGFLEGKTLALLFEKPSTRTRVSFEVGMRQLGGDVVVLTASDSQLGRGETVADTARVLSRYVDAIMARTFEHQKVLDLAQYGSVPIINGLTDLLHPCQALADLFTMSERFPRLENLDITYVGDGNNMAHSLLYGAAKVGAEIRVATPPMYAPDEEVVRNARADAAATGATIILTEDVVAAVSGAHVVYTDTWASMGQEKHEYVRKQNLQPYQLNEKLMRKARPDAIVMHCLPAHRGEEITDEVMDGPHSAVFDQAENRLHVQKAILTLLLQK